MHPCATLGIFFGLLVAVCVPAFFLGLWWETRKRRRSGKGGP